VKSVVKKFWSLGGFEIRNLNFIGIAPWRLISDTPRHNTIHQAIHTVGKTNGLSITYLGLEEHEPVSWITQVLPESIMKPFPIIKYKKITLILNSIRFIEGKRNLFYIYEGSFSWLILIKLITLKTGSSDLVCNLFPASKYERIMFNKNGMRVRYRFLFWYFSKFGDVQITVDTHHLKERINLSQKVNAKVEVFPLPSAFELLEGEKVKNNNHSRVLVNIREYPVSELSYLLSNSCKSCSFVIPVGLLDRNSDSFGLLNLNNVTFEDRSIPVENYQDYIDTFDYMVFLYKPSLDSSGKILDCITRKIPVCLPIQALEWVETSQKWNKTFLFDYGKNENVGRCFNHPVFTSPQSTDLPTCTPINTLKEFSLFKFSPKEGQLNELAMRIIFCLHYAIALLFGKVYSLRRKMFFG
jgi:hypothetical protein